MDIRYTILETEEETWYIPNNYLTITKMSIKKRKREEQTPKEKNHRISHNN